jgi:hypothetical protein
MKPDTTVKNVHLLRPLLGVRKSDLSRFLHQLNQPWREDASNASPRYARNRLRQLLAHHPALTDPLLELGFACQALAGWIRHNAPTLADEFPAALLRDQPACLAEESIRQWLAARGVPHTQVGPAVIARLLAMATDAASPSRQHFPGQVPIRRRQGWLHAVTAPGATENGG